MFYISSGIFITATVLFWLFGSATIQPWNDFKSADSSVFHDDKKEINMESLVDTTNMNKDHCETL